VSSNMTTREVDGVSIVALDGRMVFGEESNALLAKVNSLIAEGKQKIVVNMEEIGYIDSAGLGMLVAAQLSAKTHGASLRLCNLGSKFQEVLEITKLATLLQVCSSEATAIASVSK
jgi:anti-sigma B factor antagonist